jgi:putative ABC transport system permease protein
VVIHVLLRRMTELQRTQIGLLCALGFTKARVVAHYVYYAIAVAVAGGILGTLLGYWLGMVWTQMYNMFFRFPALRTQFSAAVVLQAFLLNTAMCTVGAAKSAWRVLRIEPAVAIRPQAPAAARSIHEGPLAWLWGRLPLLWRITVRNAARAWHRSFFTLAGVAISVVILVIGTAMADWMDFIINYQFGLVDRSDIHVDFATERHRAAVFEVASAEGVRRAEGILQFGAELRNGVRKKTVLVLGLPAESRLYRVHDTEGRPVRLPPDGLVIPDRLARSLGVTKGATVFVDPYLRDKDERPAVVRAVVDQFVGLSVYTTREFLADLLEESKAVNGALIEAESAALAPLIGRLDDIPGVKAVTATGAILRGFEETTKDLMRLSTVILGLFAGIIAFAVIYNSSTVSIAEQERDLACMCSLGFERGAVYKLPVVIEPDTYAKVVLAVLVFQLVARWACRRRVHRIDIVRRLKTLE